MRARQSNLAPADAATPVATALAVAVTVVRMPQPSRLREKLASVNMFEQHSLIGRTVR